MSAQAIVEVKQLDLGATCRDRTKVLLVNIFTKHFSSLENNYANHSTVPSMAVMLQDKKHVAFGIQQIDQLDDNINVIFFVCLLLIYFLLFPLHSFENIY